MSGRETARAAGGRAAARSDPERIEALKQKLRDDAYMAAAILRIATVLSARLSEGYVDGRGSS